MIKKTFFILKGQTQCAKFRDDLSEQAEQNICFIGYYDRKRREASADGVYIVINDSVTFS